MSKEYTYDIDKYTIGVDENGEDGIGMTVAKIENGEINFLGNCYGENARCIDLLIKENQELKKQYCERTDCGGRIGNSKKVEELQQENKKQKEVINKAVEYINQHWVIDDPVLFKNDLLQILRRKRGGINETK